MITLIYLINHCLTTKMTEKKGDTSSRNLRKREANFNFNEKLSSTKRSKTIRAPESKSSLSTIKQEASTSKNDDLTSSNPAHHFKTQDKQLKIENLKGLKFRFYFHLKNLKSLINIPKLANDKKVLETKEEIEMIMKQFDEYKKKFKNLMNESDDSLTSIYEFLVCKRNFLLERYTQINMEYRQNILGN